MVIHLCKKETEIALLSKQSTDMVEKIDNIETDISDLKKDINSIKDFMGTMKLASQKDNSDIKATISEGFNELKMNYSKGKQEAINEIKVRSSDKFASKLIEKIIYSVVSIILSTVFLALLYTVIKK